MKQVIFRIIVVVFANGAFLSLALAETPIVQIETSPGTITLELYPEKSPATVKNFLEYVNDGFYDGTLFHRVINGFIIQGGGFDENFAAKQTNDSLQNEANNGLKNLRGTIAMARTSDPHSATAQFFINQESNGFLDFTSETPSGWGYAVFGKVIDGLAVVDQIASVATQSVQPFQDVPVNDVVIQKMRLISESSDSSYDVSTRTLDLPVAQIGEQLYSVTMALGDNGIFSITKFDPLSASFEFAKVAYDFEANLLRVKRARVGDELYDAEFSYLGNFQLGLVDARVSE